MRGEVRERREERREGEREKGTRRTRHQLGLQDLRTREKERN